MIASLLLPAFQLTLKKPQFLCYEEVETTPTLTLEEENSFESDEIVYNDVITPSLTENQEAEVKEIDWEKALSYLYLAGVIGSVGFFLFQLFRFWRETKGGTSTRDEEGNTIVIRGGEFPPYSFLHYIIISVSDYERLRKPILAHEQAHIRLGHSWDLLLLEVVKAVQWFNPFVYLLGRDLKAIHEYEADNAVLNQGIDAKTYQLLLVTKAVGNRLQTLGNNLSHHSLKKRIKMMHKTNSNRWMMTKAVVLPALMALAVVAFAKPKVESISATENENILPADDKIADKSEDALVKLLDDGKTFIVNIPDGTLIENRAKGMNVIKVENNKTFIILPVNNTVVLLDNKLAHIQSLTNKSRTILKKVELSRDLNNYELVLTTTPVQITTSVKDDKIYDIVEENAQFPGGDMAMYKWISEHLKYPEECKEKGIQGRVMVQFVVNKDGSIPDIKVLKSPHSLLSEEAVRVVKAMPKWTPAKDKGKVVRSHFRLPINFKLPGKQTATEQGKPSEPVVQEVTSRPTGKPITETADDGIFIDYETSAEFPGGAEAMYKWIADHIKYPEECKAKGIQGRVTLSFVIEVDGSVTGVRAVRSPDDRLSQEAIRVVSAMPKWKPATQMDKPVRCNYRLPITFRLPPAQTEQKPKE
jgi:TonB family protein